MMWCPLGVWPSSLSCLLASRPGSTALSVLGGGVPTTCVPPKDLKDMMRGAGEVTYADAHKGRVNEGVVCFARRDDLDRAIDKYQGKEINGRKIKLIDDSKERSKSRSRSRSKRRSRSRSSRSKSASRSRSRSRSRSGSPAAKKAKRSASRSKSRSKSRSRSPSANGNDEAANGSPAQNGSPHSRSGSPNE